ncbi:MAG: CDP-alcohol phosphatidyltransferase family protein [bacterium]|nr:CDP-alcohol phosphatidyltransferase family protein [bacterium]
MASVYQLKGKFQGLLRPLVVKLAARGVTANQVTIAATVLSVLYGALMLYVRYERVLFLLLPLFLFFRMALNAVDGMLAREHNMKSRLGAVLNELGDVISDTALYLPFALVTFEGAGIVIIICFLAVISEMTGVVGLQIGASRRYDGPMGKSDRAAAFGMIGFFIGVGFVPGWWFTLALVAILLLVAYTIYNRASKALKESAA